MSKADWQLSHSHITKPVTCDAGQHKQQSIDLPFKGKLSDKVALLSKTYKIEQMLEHFLAELLWGVCVTIALSTVLQFFPASQEKNDTAI